MFIPVVALLSSLLQPAARADTIRATITAVLAEDSPRTPFLFGVVTGIAIDTAGRVYVSDGGESRIAVFSSDGKSLAKIGRKGKGPGEFEYPTGPVVGDDGALYVRNMSAVSRFVIDPKTGIASRFDRSFRGPTFAPWMSRRATVIDRSGRLHFPMEWEGKDGLSHVVYQRYALDGRELDSLPVPTQPTLRGSTAWVEEGRGGGRMLKGLNVVPFHPVPVSTVSSIGTIISSPSDSYLLQESDASQRVIRTVRRNVVPPPIPPAERADSTHALGRRLDSLKVPLEQVRGMSEEVKAKKLPTTYPIFRSLSTAHDGTLWARRWSESSQRNESWFDLLDASGRFVRTVVVPADCATQPVPVIRGGVFACLSLEPDTDAERVVIARVPVTR
ncbi:MAG TPA: 6-bladed beta-propeller [Casimicrobiaceae bacterium]|nr:6-bladed beta-propeller [Casimicrobiaceae bacterium]